MSTHFKATASMATLLLSLSLAVPAAAQTTIFNTKDFHQDRALWTNPAYYRNNTPGQLAGMALNIVPYQGEGQVGAARLYGSQGTGTPGATNLASIPSRPRWSNTRRGSRTPKAAPSRPRTRSPIGAAFG